MSATFTANRVAAASISRDTTAYTRRLAKHDIEAVVEIHLEQFPRARSSQLGKPFVRKMYYWFLSEQPDVSIVAVLNDQPVGFAVGAFGGYGRKIFRYGLPQVLWGIVTHPGLLTQRRTFQLWTSFARSLAPRFSTKGEPPKDNAGVIKASLSSIAVARAAQGRGIGKIVMRAFEEAARRQGATLLGLSVDSDNTAARRLYEACDWNLRDDNTQTNSAYYSKTLI